MNEEMNLIVTFAILSLINVTFSTVKSLVTIKGDKYSASLINGLYYAYYNIVIIYTVAEFNMLAKCVVTFFANIIGVFIVKFFDEKFKKDTRWVYTVTCEESNSNVKKIYSILKEAGIKSLYSEIVEDNLYSMHIFSNTKSESRMIESILDNYKVAFHVVEDVRKTSKTKKHNN